MKRLLPVVVLLLTASSALAAETTARYTVVLRSESARERLPRVMTNSDEAAARQVRTFHNINAFAANLTSSEVAELRRSSDVESIQPVLRRSINDVALAPATTNAGPGDVESNVSPFKTQHIPWGLEAIHARDVWPVTKGNASVNVAVLDTGIDLNHPDLKQAYAGGVNLVDPTKPPQDDHKHGTHVSGTIAATDNTIGVVGIAPNVKIWAVKVLNGLGEGTDENVALGIDWVVSRAKALGGRWVINMSLGAYEPSELEDAAVQNAVANGVVVVAGAGNRGIAILDFPAGYRNVIAVGATDEQNKRAGFSSYGPGMGVTAPGVNVASTLPEGTNTAADIEVAGQIIDGWGLGGAPKGVVNGPFVYVGVGQPEDYPSNMAGKIAVSSRGVLQFREKARNAKNAGAKALVIINSIDDHDSVVNWSLIVRKCNENGCIIEPEWVDYEFPLTIGVSYADGEKLRALSSNATARLEYRFEPYGLLDGTSMSTPHVAGAAALLLSLAPETNVAEITHALEATAKDLGTPGWDFDFSNGLVDVFAAAKYLKPSAFGLTQPPPITPGKRRSGH
jgi:subtilisin family serine protease